MKLINYQKNIHNGDKKTVPSVILKIFSLCLLCFCLLSTKIYAKPIQSIEKIRFAAKKFLEEKQISADKSMTDIKIGKIDPRLRLAECQQDLDIFLPQVHKRSGKMTVGIKCQGPIQWKIFVSATVTQYQQAWVLNKNLSKTDVITRSDLMKQKVVIRDSRKLPFTDLKKMLNTSPKRTLRSGSVVFQDSVCLVCRGDKVSVSATNQFLNISVEGVALSDAVLGEKVQVRNSQSKKIFTASVVGKNQLNVKL